VGVDTDSDTDWQFGLQALDKGGLRRGTVNYVHDGDTIHISPVSSKATDFITYNATQHLIPIPPYSITDEGKIYSSPFGMAGIQSVRLNGLDAPELGTEEGNESKRILEQLCLGKEVVFDVDDCSQYDKYDRILAMVYVNDTNVNQEMLINGSAIPLIILPSEFVPCANYTYTPLKLNPVVNQSVTFNASSSWTFDPDAAIISYKWSFGDGTKGTGKITNHTYQSPGNYTVCLEVTDSDGEERRCNAVDITLRVYLTEGQPPIAGTPLLRCGC
jgi:endonuclease YncB( thermonuclease family)